MWDLATSRKVHSLELRKGRIVSFAQLPNGLVACGGNETAVGILDMKRCTVVKWLQGHKKSITHVCHIENDIIASCGFDGRVLIYDTNAPPSKECIRVIDFHSQETVNAVIRVTSDNIASCSNDCVVACFNFRTGEHVWSRKEHTSYVSSLCMVNVTTLVSGSHDKTLIMWNVSTGDASRTIRCEARIRSVIPGLNGSFVCCSSNGLIYTYSSDFCQEFVYDTKNLGWYLTAIEHQGEIITSTDEGIVFYIAGTKATSRMIPLVDKKSKICTIAKISYSCK
jgi:WD40 repeat protein